MTEFCAPIQSKEFAMPVIQVRLGNHPVLIESSDVTESGYVKATRGGRTMEEMQNAAVSLADTIRGVVEEIDAAIRDAMPAQAEVELGVKFIGEGSALLAKIGAEANLKITLKWGVRESH